MMGPFETEQQARETPEVQAVYAAFSADPGVGKMAAHTHRMLMAACTAASVQLGAYDRRVLAWLSGFEPETAAVVAGLILRAHAAGRAGPEQPEADDRGACTGTALQQMARAAGAGEGDAAAGLEELAGLINFRVGAWQDFGYAEPPAPECAPIPPLGQRSAKAIEAGHEAVKDIDQLIARLHQVRAQLVSELRQDEDVRTARIDEFDGGGAS